VCNPLNRTLSAKSRSGDSWKRTIAVNNYLDEPGLVVTAVMLTISLFHPAPAPAAMPLTLPDAKASTCDARPQTHL
jgi:hypothetical protein